MASAWPPYSRRAAGRRHRLLWGPGADQEMWVLGSAPRLRFSGPGAPGLGPARRQEGPLDGPTHWLHCRGHSSTLGPCSAHSARSPRPKIHSRPPSWDRSTQALSPSRPHPTVIAPNAAWLSSLLAHVTSILITNTPNL